MSPLEELLLELGRELSEALTTVDWIDDHHDIDVQFLRHHIKSVLHEIDYLNAQEIPA